MSYLEAADRKTTVGNQKDLPDNASARVPNFLRYRLDDVNASTASCHTELYRNLQKLSEL